jgi:Dolichyl-phosphate-mannose-protein mannosyltransferase
MVGGLVIVRTAVSAYLINRPGLQYDETLFVNAATLRIPGVFLLHSAGGIPLMVFPYIGALKSWLYAPVFSVFGTTAATIRLPAVVIVGLGILLLYPAVREFVTRPVALLTCAALCFDNSVFWLTRDDVGPSAIEIFLKCACLYCAARFARTRSTRWLVLLLAALLLGTFNKLNFIWTVNAVAVASVIVAMYYRRSIREHTRAIAIWVGGLAVIYASFAAYYFGEHIGSLLGGSGGGLGQPWSLFRMGTEWILSGTWFYAYALGPLGTRTGIALVVIVLFLVGTLASVALRPYRNIAVACIALITVLIAVQNLLTPQGTAGWHYVAVYPFVTVVAAYGAYAGAHALLPSRRSAYAALGVIGVITLAYDGALLGKYFASLSSREPSNPAWSPAVYQLSRDVEAIPGTVFTADWGISNPLFALHPSRRYDELAFDFEASTPASAKQTARSVAMTPGPKLVVTHANDKLEFPHANANLFRTLGPHLHFLETINGRDGRPLYELYSYR